MREFEEMPVFTFNRRTRGIALSVIVGLVFLIVLGRSVRLVRPGYVAVKIVFGKVAPATVPSGLHLINPFAVLIPMEVRTQEYTMSGRAREGRVRGDDAIEALTSEGLRVRLEMTVWYRVDPAKADEIFETIGLDYEAKILRPAIRTAIRDVAARYLTADIYSHKREMVTSDIFVAIKEALDGRGIVTERVLLRNVELPVKIADAIDMKLAAEQEAKKMEFVLQKAEKEVEIRVVEAKGRAEAQRIINRTLTAKYLQHTAIQAYKELAASENKTFVIMPTSPTGTGMPLIIGQ